MVSALVTSPRLQARIFSGDAIEILIALKSFSVLGLSKLRRGCNVVPPQTLASGTNSDFQELDVQTEALELTNQHIERLGQTRLFRHFALDDRFVDAAAAFDVVRLHGQQFLQRVGGAVSLESPDFHLSEPLASELRLAAERLLRD